MHSNKHNDMKLFLDTLLYMFGIGENPIQVKHEDNDMEAIHKDWINIGNDIRTALGRYGEQQTK